MYGTLAEYDLKVCLHLKPQIIHCIGKINFYSPSCVLHISGSVSFLLDAKLKLLYTQLGFHRNK